MQYDYDVIVIGGGSGGSGFSKRAAGYGAKVCLIERGTSRDENGNRVGAGIGGTCVNVGCVPKKIMFMAAAQREAMVGGVATAKGNGFTVPETAGVFDWASVKERRDAYVKRLNGSYESGWKKLGIDMVLGLATFVDAQTVSVKLAGGSGGTRVVTAPKVLIACGGVPSLPDIPGAELSITSDGFFDLAQQPKKVAVLGAGYIAVEMAGILAGLGSDTHLFFRGDTVLRRGFDPYIVSTLMTHMEKHGPALHSLSTPTRLAREKDGSLTVSLKKGGTFGGFDCVLSAIGRRPVTGLLNLEAAGVEVDPRGLIKVDAFENTSAAGSVFAIGDATTSGYELTPVAIAAGRRLADRLFGGEPSARLEYKDIATVVFSHPPIGTVGLTEPDAKEKFGEDNVKVKQARFPSMMYAFNDDESKVKTALKLVLAGKEEKIVGLHCIGPASDEMIQGFAVAVKMGATRHDFEASVAIHPTIAEEMVTFGGWGQVKDGDGVAKPRLPPHLSQSPSFFTTNVLPHLFSAVAGGAAVAIFMNLRGARRP
jgi:glutathione reductase (NADPH)